MIKAFKCKETEKIWNDLYTGKFPSEIQDRALIKLSLIDAAVTLEDLKNPPGNGLKGLVGKRKGQMSIRINNRWRICFLWYEGEAYEVEIIDYH